MDYVTLNNGVKMPQLGYGVYQTPTEETESCVLTAIKNGYRSIDTAQAFDFVLTDEEMKQIEVLDTGKSLFFSHYSPETVECFMSIV